MASVLAAGADAVFDHLDTATGHLFDLAQREAQVLNHNYLGTEHLLAALAIQEGPAAGLLAAAGCGPAAIRAEILSLIGRGRPPRRDPDTLLAAIGIDMAEVRRRVESTFGTDAVHRAAVRVRPSRRRWPGARWWPGCDEGRPCDSALLGGQWLGVAPRVKRVLEMATNAAAPRLAAPLHILIATIDEGEGVACQILERRAVDLQALASAARRSLS